MTARPNRVTHTGLPHHNGALTPTHAAIAAYRAWSADPLFIPPPTVAQVRLVAEHCQEWTYSPLVCLTCLTHELAELRLLVVQIKTLDNLADWLWDCRRLLQIDPLENVSGDYE